MAQATLLKVLAGRTLATPPSMALARLLPPQAPRSPTTLSHGMRCPAQSSIRSSAPRAAVAAMGSSMKLQSLPTPTILRQRRLLIWISPHPTLVIHLGLLGSIPVRLATTSRGGCSEAPQMSLTPQSIHRRRTRATSPSPGLPNLGMQSRSP